MKKTVIYVYTDDNSLEFFQVNYSKEEFKKLFGNVLENANNFFYIDDENNDRRIFKTDSIVKVVITDGDDE